MMAEDTLARGRLYRLFGELYLRGLTAELIPAARRLPELGDLVPQPFDADEAAADHFQLFGLDVAPYASVFLDAQGQLGGATTETVQQMYAEAGIDPDPRNESADHIGPELMLLARLVDVEVGGSEGPQSRTRSQNDRSRDLQRRFLDGHLLWWLPAFAYAVQQQNQPFWNLLAELTLDVVLDHRAALGNSATEQPCIELPEPPLLLEDERTGLKDIAAYLATPVWSGFYLSRGDIARLGRSHCIPRGFGARMQTLTNLLRAASEFDQLGAVMNALLSRVDHEREHYRKLREAEAPVIGTVADQWLKRLAATRQLVQRIAEASTTMPDSGR